MLHDKTLPVIVEGANHNNPTSHGHECISCVAANLLFTTMLLEALSLLSSSVLQNRCLHSLRCLLADTSSTSHSQSLSFLTHFSFPSHSLFSLAPPGLLLLLMLSDFHTNIHRASLLPTHHAMALTSLIIDSISVFHSESPANMCIVLWVPQRKTLQCNYTITATMMNASMRLQLH